jgi:uncharacterized membrane protein
MMIKDRTVKLTVTIIFSVLVCVATMSFTIYVPSTKGFFNIGETMVFITALLFGPIVGTFAGGVGSMFADIFLGYYHYALATLVIKAFEGGLVGFLNRKKFFTKFLDKRKWKVFTFFIGVLVGTLVSYIGFFYYSGVVEVYSGFPPSENPILTIFIPIEFWIILGFLVTFLITAVAFISEPEFGWMVISTIIGGLSMVSGYFLYQQFILGVVALAEVPINIGQMTIGVIVATPIVKIIQSTLPQLKSS